MVSTLLYSRITLSNPRSELLRSGWQPFSISFINLFWNINRIQPSSRRNSSPIVLLDWKYSFAMTGCNCPKTFEFEKKTCMLLRRGEGPRLQLRRNLGTCGRSGLHGVAEETLAWGGHLQQLVNVSQTWTMHASYVHRDFTKSDLKL